MPHPPVKSQKIAKGLEQKIRNGSYSPDDWLPSERDLASQFSVSRPTVRRALLTLAERGLIQIKPQAGAQVCSPAAWRPPLVVEQRLDDVSGVRVAVSRVETPVISSTLEKISANSALAKRLKVAKGTTVYEYRRLHGVVGEKPTQLVTIWIPQGVASDLGIAKEATLEPNEHYSLLVKGGYELLFEETVGCRLLDVDERRALQVDEGEPVLETWRTCSDQNGRVVEVAHRLIVPSRYQPVYRAYM